MTGRPAELPLIGPTDAAASSVVAGNSLTVAAWTTISRVTGLGRVVAIAAVLGPTYLGNTYQATNLVPNLVFELLAGSLLAGLIVPPLLRHLADDDLERAARVAGGFLGVTVCILAAAGAALALGAPLLLDLIAVGVDDPATAAAQEDAGWLLLALLAPQVVLYGVAGVGAAVQNSRGRFALAAGAPSIENVGIVAMLVIYALEFGTDSSLETVGTGQLLLLGLGTTLAVALHAGAQWVGAARAGIVLVPRTGWPDAEVREIARRGVASLGYSGLNAVRIFAAVVVANRVAGGVVAFGIALNLFYLPVAIGARPFATALLPRLSRLFNAGAFGHFRAELAGGFALVLFVTVPAAVFLALLSGLVGDAVFFGEDQSAGATLVAAALIGLAPGIVGEASFVLSTQASYATHDTRGPFHAMAVRTVLSIAGVVAAFAFDAPAAVLACLGASFSLGNLVGAWRLRRQLGSRVGRTRASTARVLARDLLASALMGVVALVIGVAVAATFPSEAGEILGLLAAAVAGVIVFLLAQRALRAPELELLAGGFRQLRFGGSV
ncbi:MAG: murein biosynthesis integral membrane protein MurJ [Gaiellaceae bacterium]